MGRYNLDIRPQRKGEKHMTLKEIAEASGYSISAVSKALAGAPDISETAKKEILKLAGELGYTPKRKLKKVEPTRPLTIGLLIPTPSSGYFSRISYELEQMLRAEGALLVIGYSQYDPETEAADIRAFQRSGMVDAIISVSPNNVADSIPKCDVPLLVISQTDAELHLVDSVKVDDSYGIQCAIEQLYQLGHRRIAYVGELKTQTRLGYYKKALAACGLQPESELVAVSELESFSAGYEGMQAILRQTQQPPTAVFCAYDKIAIGAWSAIAEFGRRVPEDISIFGLDNSRNVHLFGKTLTTIDCHIHDQLSIALDILKRKLRDPSYTTIQVTVIKTDLQPGDTIGLCTAP